jgi:hypothetical protein
MCESGNPRFWCATCVRAFGVLCSVILGLALAFGPSGRCLAQCRIGCLAGQMAYNDWDHDYETDAPVCITYARAVIDGAQCVNLRTMRRSQQPLPRFCGAIGQRGESAPSGTLVDPKTEEEPYRCAIHVGGYYYYLDEGEGEGSTFRMTPVQRAALEAKDMARPR